ncbi:hypothetical protein CRENBAI_006929 [Crenichthys baileyi]|uniref:Uncharacterized protein n=1 Tax=Crenichthys baileyi TaxID=28760 RepID=A0AAV9S6I1_9TELE
MELPGWAMPPTGKQTISAAGEHTLTRRSHRPNKKEPAGSARSNNQECGLTIEKRADQLAQCNQNIPHKGGHMTNMPIHPRTHGAEPTERPVPDAWHRTAAMNRQAGQQNTSHTNTEAINKSHPTQNGSPTQMQAPGQHRHMQPHRQTNRSPQGQPRSQADSAMHHRAHHRAQGKEASPAS